MIQDDEFKQGIQEQWSAISELEKRLKPIISQGLMGGFRSNGSPDESYNLLLVLAYSSLDEVLSQCIAEHVFECPLNGRRFLMLGTKMESSKISITWNAYDLIDEGKKARNNLAHQSVFANKNDCIKYVEAVRKELKIWGLFS
jgi:hypothetical protein